MYLCLGLEDKALLWIVHGFNVSLLWKFYKLLLVYPT